MQLCLQQGSLSRGHLGRTNCSLHCSMSHCPGASPPPQGCGQCGVGMVTSQLVSPPLHSEVTKQPWGVEWGPCQLHWLKNSSGRRGESPVQELRGLVLKHSEETMELLPWQPSEASPWASRLSLGRRCPGKGRGAVGGWGSWDVITGRTPSLARGWQRTFPSTISVVGERKVRSGVAGPSLQYLSICPS